MTNPSFDYIKATSTIIKDKDYVKTITPIYPIFNEENSEYFSLGEMRPSLIDLNNEKYISYPLKPNVVVPLLDISGSGIEHLCYSLNTDIMVNKLWFYVQKENYGITLPMNVLFAFSFTEKDLSLKLKLDTIIKTEISSFMIETKVKGFTRLDNGTINIWIEDAKVLDKDGKDYSNSFQLIGYTVSVDKIKIEHI